MTRRHFLAATTLTALAGAANGSFAFSHSAMTILEDVTLSDDKTGPLLFGNKWLQLEFDRKTGQWRSLRHQVHGELLNLPARTVEAVVNGKPRASGDANATFSGYQVQVLPDRSGATLSFAFSLPERSDAAAVLHAVAGVGIVALPH